ncbi:hypothetical protein [Mycolicibacterium thermoresistibile]
MPETKAWSGDAHAAASSMFERAETRTSDFSEYTTAIGEALLDGDDTIGRARIDLLNKASQIDMTGQLYVDPQWVVLLIGAQMTAEEAAALEKRAQSEQVNVNKLLLAVGAADDGTAASINAAVRSRGFEAPAPTALGSLLLPGLPRPEDEVPNPSTPVGATQQALIRDATMAETVRDTVVETRYDADTGEETATVTTVYKQDGSKHVTTVNAKSHFSDRSPLTVEKHFDKSNNLISKTESVTYNDPGIHSWAGSKSTTVEYADGTLIMGREFPDGRRSISVKPPNRPEADVPLDLLNHPVLSSASAGFSGLEAQAGRGIPMVSAELSEHVRVGSKYAGPGISILAAAWDVAVADTGFQRCVAAAEGAASLGAGTLGGIVGSSGGPPGAFFGSLFASAGGQAIGNWLGNTFCPR